MQNEKKNVENKPLENSSNEPLQNELNLSIDMTDQNTFGYKRHLECNQNEHSKKLKNVAEVTNDLINDAKPSTSSEKNDLSGASSNPSLDILNKNVPSVLDMKDNVAEEVDNRNEASNNRISNVDYAENQYDLNYAEHPEDESNSERSSSPDIHCSRYSTETLVEKLQNENTFYEALCELKELLKEEKNLKGARNLYSIMQNVYFHVFSLVEKKIHVQADDAILKSDLIEHLKQSCKLLIDIESLFKSLQEFSVCFTKSQKKFVKLWKKHCCEWKIQFFEELVETCYGNPLDENYELRYENDHSFSSSSNDVDHVASVICEKLNNEETFYSSADILLSCLEKEECTYIKIPSFYTLVKSIQNHVTKLQNKYEEALKNVPKVSKCFKDIFHSLTKVEKIYAALSLKQNIYFTSSEKENFKVWKTYAEELRLNVKEKIAEEERKTLDFFTELNGQIQQIRETTRAVRDGCEEVHKTLAVMKMERKRDFQALDNQIAAMQIAVLNSQKVMSKIRKESNMNKLQIKELKNIAKQKMEEKFMKDDKSE